MRRLALLVLLLAPLHTACGQLLADTLFTWQDYGRRATCAVQIFAAPADEDRTHVIVLRELAQNDGASTVTDARFLAEQVGRHFDVDPAEAFWIFHWGAFSFDGAREDRGKELFLRATFRRTSRHSLSTPHWRVVSRTEVEDLTDRLFR